MNKTIVELDLISYSAIASTLEGHLGSSAVATLNAQIQTFIDHGLSQISLPRNAAVAATTGDGAILVLTEAADAHHFAFAVHEQTKMYNRERSDPLAKRIFRIGAATGDIAIESSGDGHFNIAGLTIARAVRLEAAAQPGELVVDSKTFHALPPLLQVSYGDEVGVAGKRDEKFAAHRCMMNPEAGTVVGSKTPERFEKPTGDRRSILELFARLHPSSLDRLVFLLEIPIADQPARTLSAKEKEHYLLNYSSGTEARLAKLESELQYLLENQSADYQPVTNTQPRSAPAKNEVRVKNSEVGQLAIISGDNNIIS
jgi:class 3 adenylate cyclase